MNSKKYGKRYFLPPVECFDWVKKDTADHAPVWCSVDLRDGNQALAVPMSSDEKLLMWETLIKIGFKEIEIGFPAASETEYAFCRRLIEQNLIPDDVTIQVLTQAREHIILKTFEALKGCKNAIVHLYNSTSVAQREQVFSKSREEITLIATEGAKLIKTETDKFRVQNPGCNIRFEYSPESFTGTEPEFSLAVCNAVINQWESELDNRIIINLPVTVEESMPHVYASQVEYMCKHLNHREKLVISLHPHNDRGTAVSDCELGLIAGGDRIEGTLFGNGERTGNADIVTIAMNMFTQGIDPGLDFSDLPEITEIYGRVTGMTVFERQPYSGALVFAAFSGSHQDAIAKGMKYRETHPDRIWNVPYLCIDPKDIGRNYDGDIIRINSQSGKGGVGFILEHNFGFILPKPMREAVGYAIKDISDKAHRELSPDAVLEAFKENFVNRSDYFDVFEAHYTQTDGKRAAVTIRMHDGTFIYRNADGNGRLDAVSQAVKDALGINFNLLSYSEHALTQGSSSKAAAYVGIEVDGKTYWGAGVHEDIIDASVSALVSAVNNAHSAQMS
ncbi:MAG: 2-isopropylmalate synthase [Ruminococcus sp.]|nr:2-isopropylmalate synthase [Ruminococcus sp.]